MKTITIAGTAGKDAELKHTQDGDALAVFSLAVDDGYGDKKTTMWFDCTVFGKRGAALAPHITKGSKLTVIGDLSRREHDGKTYLTVRASEVALQGGNQRHDSQPARERAAPAARSSPAPTSSYDDMNDDLPF